MDGTRKQRATWIGLGAIALWAVLAPLTAIAGRIPPFQMAAMTFTVGTGVGLVYARLTGRSLGDLKDIPLGAWALGIYGLLVFHVSYFVALQSAPALEASLIVYLWPLLIVILSAMLPARAGGGRLHLTQLAGALLGLGGTGLLLVDAAGRPEFSGSRLGYLCALLAALVWSSYSVASRLFATVPSHAVIGSCAATAIGSALLHAATEVWVWPATGASWLAIVALGLGPIGLAFYLWDEGMKHGDLRFLGVASYATPLLSTLIMILSGLGRASIFVAFAAVLITAGAALASRAADAKSL